MPPKTQSYGERREGGKEKKNLTLIMDIFFFFGSVLFSVTLTEHPAVWGFLAGLVCVSAESRFLRVRK